MLTLVKIIILLGFLVFIHEGGHLNYEIRLIPLGGFVNLEGEEELSDKEGSFSKASTSKHIKKNCDNFSRCISEYYFWANCIFYSNIS